MSRNGILSTRARELWTAIGVAADAEDAPRAEHLRECLADELAVARPDDTGRAQLLAPFDGVEDPVEFFAKPKDGLRLRIPGFDNVMGPVSTEIVLLGGLPSAGKSTLAVQIADEALEAGWHVLVVAWEQSWKTWEGISTARRANINSRNVTEGTTSPHAREAIRGALDEQRMAFVAERRRYVDPPPNSVAELSRLVAAMQKEMEDPDHLLVIVDAVHDMPATKAQTRRDAIDEVIGDLRVEIARKHHVPVLGLVHVNDNGDPKESKTLLYKADISLLLEPDTDKMTQAIDAVGAPYNYYPVKAIVKKNRDGEAPVSRWLDFHAAVRRFDEQDGGFRD